jgi:hypothetical protein
MGFNVASLQRSRADHLTKLTKEIEDSESSGYVKDDRYWQPEADKTGKGEAVIRFLPEIDDEPMFVKLYSQSFKHGDRWYIENSRTTLEGEKDPCSEEFWRIRKPGTEEAKTKASKFSRKLNYISNILVVDDPANPENNGQVRLFKYGKVIFDMLKDALEPKFAGQKPLDAFDLLEGANFHIRFYKKDGFRKYDKSGFDEVAPIAPSDKAIAKLLDGKGWSLNAEIAPDKFKSYEDLRKKFNDVLGRDDGEVDEKPLGESKPARARLTSTKPVEDDDSLPWEEPKNKGKAKPASGDDELDAFSSMADED